MQCHPRWRTLVVSAAHLHEIETHSSCTQLSFDWQTFIYFICQKLWCTNTILFQCSLIIGKCTTRLPISFLPCTSNIDEQTDKFALFFPWEVCVLTSLHSIGILRWWQQFILNWQDSCPLGVARTCPILTYSTPALASFLYSRNQFSITTSRMRFHSISFISFPSPPLGSTLEFFFFHLLHSPLFSLSLGL